jgi:hypothetical protein
MNEFEKVPCFYNPILDCPKSCKSHEKATEDFKRLIKGRNETFGSNLTPKDVLEGFRQSARTSRRVFSIGIEKVFSGAPGSEKCSQREKILASELKNSS